MITHSTILQYLAFRYLNINLLDNKYIADSKQLLSLQ